MKTIKIFYRSYDWKQRQPSKSFMKKMSIALTEQISNLVESIEYKKYLVDMLEIRY